MVGRSTQRSSFRNHVNIRDQQNQEEGQVWDVEAYQRHHAPVARFGRKIDASFFSLMRLAALLDSVWVPFLISFGQLHSVSTVIHKPNVIICDAFMNGVYVCGVLAQLRTSYVVLATGAEHVHPLQILIYRFTSPSFWADLASCLGGFWWHKTWHTLAGLRMLRLWRLSPSADDLYELHHAELSSDSATRNLLSLFFFTFLVMHLFACTWFLTEIGVSDWEELMLTALPDDISGYNVVFSLYANHMKDGATMLAGWGGPPANAEDGKYTMAEIVAWCILSPLSALVNGVIFVELVEITHQFSASTEKHLQRLGELGAVLDSLHAPKSLKTRCMKYHCFLSIHNANRKEYESMFDALSQRLQDEIKIHLFDELVHSAPFFRAIPEELIYHLVISCLEEVYGPGQSIMRQGDVGTDFFFVMKGSADVFINEQFIATKEVGEYFGEVGLVYDAPRTASVCARSFTIVARLTRDSFVEVLAQGTQEVRDEVTRMIMERVVTKPAPEEEHEITPLLSAERQGPSQRQSFVSNLGNAQRNPGGRKSLAECMHHASSMQENLRRSYISSPQDISSPQENGVESGGSMEVRHELNQLKNRLDHLTVVMEKGFTRLETQMQQFRVVADAQAKDRDWVLTMPAATTLSKPHPLEFY